MKTIARIGIFLFASMLPSRIYAQEGLNAAGGNCAGTEGSISFSVGQTVFTACESTSGSVVAGVQQPYEISVLSVAEGTEKNNLTIYPNPTADCLYLKLASAEHLINACFQLTDLTGKLLMSGKISSIDTHLNLGDMPPATYILTVSNNNKELKSFKIIKKKEK